MINPHEPAGVDKQSPSQENFTPNEIFTNKFLDLFEQLLDLVAERVGTSETIPVHERRDILAKLSQIKEGLDLGESNRKKLASIVGLYGDMIISHVFCREGYEIYQEFAEKYFEKIMPADNYEIDFKE